MERFKLIKNFKIPYGLIYSFFIFCLLFFLVLINNYFFYKSAERNSEADAIQFSKLLNTYYENCKEREDNIAICNEGIVSLTKTYSTTAFYNKSLRIIKENGDTIWIKNFKTTGTVVSSDITITLPKNYTEPYVTFYQTTTFSNYLVFISVLKSLTLSVVDVVDKMFEKKYASQDGTFRFINKDIHTHPSRYISYSINGQQSSLLQFYTFKVRDGQTVKKGDVIATGNFHVAIDRFFGSYIYRSGPALLFLCFILLLSYMNKCRERQKVKQQQLIQIQKDKELLDAFTVQSELENKQSPEVLSTVISDTIERFNKYNHLINPPMNLQSYEKIFTENIHEIELGVKFRRVIEKLSFELYEKYIGPKPALLSLSDAIKELNYKRVISMATFNYLHLIRTYGNENAHYSGQEHSNIQTINIATSLITVIEEIVQKLENAPLSKNTTQNNVSQPVVQNLSKSTPTTVESVSTYARIIEKPKASPKN